jgi:hypothetical protein
MRMHAVGVSFWGQATSVTIRLADRTLSRTRIAGSPDKVLHSLGLSIYFFIEGDSKLGILILKDLPNQG